MTILGRPHAGRYRRPKEPLPQAARRFDRSRHAAVYHLEQPRYGQNDRRFDFQQILRDLPEPFRIVDRAARQHHGVITRRALERVSDRQKRKRTVGIVEPERVEIRSRNSTEYSDARASRPSAARWCPRCR